LLVVVIVAFMFRPLIVACEVRWRWREE